MRIIDNREGRIVFDARTILPPPAPRTNSDLFDRRYVIQEFHHDAPPLYLSYQDLVFLQFVLDGVLGPRGA